MRDETFVLIIGFTAVIASLEGFWAALAFVVVMLLLADKS